MSYEVIHADCLTALLFLFSDNSVDAIVTDPPYELGFMGKSWDASGIAYSVELWRECLRVLKPGGHLLAFSGSRTYHRMTCAIEDAGFEVRDQIMWVYGSGFPKSLDVSKAIDKAAGVEREIIGQGQSGATAGMQALGPSGIKGGAYDITAPATDAARQWQGWGTALKPAHEPICVARKPLVGTVAQNVLTHGTGAMNIDGCRVGDEVLPAITAGKAKIGTFERGVMVTPERTGRWPANLIHDGSEEVTALLNDAARFFYCPKASKRDRSDSNTHPTVKPTDLMRYLCRLVTPPGGVVLDPFMGSGSTGKAAMLEGFRFVGIEREADYMTIAEARIRAALEGRE